MRSLFVSCGKVKHEALSCIAFHVSHNYILSLGTPLDIEKYEFYDQLHPGEVTIASTLRLLPEQYIRCKRVLILAAQEAHKEGTPFRKSEAQKLCRIDVNKVSTLWSTFGKLGWLNASSSR